MKNKVYIIAIAILAAILLLVSIFFILHANKLKSRISQSVNMIQKVESELSRAREEKESMAKSNEKLQSDSVSYLAINSKLTSEKDEIDKKLQGAQKIIETKEANLQRVQQRLTDIEKRVNAEKKEQDEKLAKEKKALEKKVIKTAVAIKNERGVYHYNLGVAYAQAKLYGEAIEEYEKSIKFDPDNADTYYNLGVLYETVEADTEKAIANYRRYLELNPAPEDIDEIRGRIKRLGG
ncbi:MAG: tetratricopeptide repeat protein [Candidatus Omnitrophica bacterium]|nr:tetratricopeptide repeat protein [Candidatus Omnitrophota bacterium]